MPRPKRYKMSEKSIEKLRESMRKHHATSPLRRGSIDDAKKELIMELYNTSELTIKQIAEQASCSEMSIYRLLREK